MFKQVKKKAEITWINLWERIRKKSVTVKRMKKLSGLRRKGCNPRPILLKFHKPADYQDMADYQECLNKSKKGRNNMD